MEKSRWFFPFTHGVDMHAIDQVVRLAEFRGATLVPVSLIHIPHEGRSQGVRLEHIQQSKDFLEAVQWKAVIYEVPVEHHEIFTYDVIQSITTLIYDLHCDNIVLVTRREEDVLLEVDLIRCLLASPPASLVLIRLPASTRRKVLPHLGNHVLSWLHRHWGHQHGTNQVQHVPAVTLQQGEMSPPTSPYVPT